MSNRIAALNDVLLSTVIQYHTIGYIDVCINIVQRPVGHSGQILRRTSLMLCLLTMQLLVGRFVHVPKYVLYNCNFYNQTLGVTSCKLKITTLGSPSDVELLTHDG